MPRSLHTTQTLRGFTPSSPGAPLPALAGLGRAPVCSIAAAVSRSHTRRTALSLRRSAAVKTCGGGAPPPPDPDAATTPSESEVMAVSSAAAARSPCGTAPCGAHALSTRQSTRAHGKCRRTRGHTARRSARARATPRCSARARAPAYLGVSWECPRWGYTAEGTRRAHGVPAAERRKSLPRLPPRSVEHGARPPEQRVRAQRLARRVPPDGAPARGERVDLLRHGAERAEWRVWRRWTQRRRRATARQVLAERTRHVVTRFIDAGRRCGGSLPQRDDNARRARAVGRAPGDAMRT